MSVLEPADWCKQCRRPRTECDPGIRHVHSFTCGKGLWDAVTRAAEAGRVYRNQAIETAFREWVALPDGEPATEPLDGEGVYAITRTVRCSDELWDQMAARTRRAGLKTDSEGVRSALRRYVTLHGQDAAGPETPAAVRQLQAELDQARAELARLTHVRAERAELARRFALADALADASPNAPATPALLAALTGYHRKHLFHLLRSLVSGGYITKAGRGEYLPVPGTDMGRGVREAVADASEYAAATPAERRAAAKGRNRS